MSVQVNPSPSKPLRQEQTKPLDVSVQSANRWQSCPVPHGVVLVTGLGVTLIGEGVTPGTGEGVTGLTGEGVIGLTGDGVTGLTGDGVGEVGDAPPR